MKAKGMLVGSVSKVVNDSLAFSTSVLLSGDSSTSHEGIDFRAISVVLEDMVTDKSSPQVSYHKAHS